MLSALLPSLILQKFDDTIVGIERGIEVWVTMEQTYILEVQYAFKQKEIMFVQIQNNYACSKRWQHMIIR